MRLEILNKTRVAGDITELPAENLSPIDASPLLLKTVNCPSLKFSYRIDFPKMHHAAVDLLQEYPILAGRITKASKHELSKHPYLKAAPYCINLSAADAGIMLYEAAVDAAASNLLLNQALAEPFGITPGSIVLPPWYQPLDVAAMFQGKEPLLKLQLTHCSDGGSILAATMPHLLADSHSSTLLLTRLSELYTQQKDTYSLNTPPSTLPVPAQTNTAAAAETEEFLNVAPRTGSYTGTNTSMTGVAFNALRSSASELLKPKAEAEAVGTGAAPATSTAGTSELTAVGGGGENAVARRAANFTGSLSSSQAVGVAGVAYERVALHHVSSGKSLTAAAAAPARASATAAAAAVAAVASPAATALRTAAAAAVVDIERQSVAKHLAKEGGATDNRKPWSKALLLPQGRKDVAKPTALKALSLDLQSVDKPSLSSTLSWLAAAFKEGLAASRAFPGAASSLTSCLLNIPQADVVQLKALAFGSSLGSVPNPISTNDAISALVWLTFCNLRGRPLPGSGSSSNGSKKPCKSFGMFSCGRHNMPKEADTTAAAAADAPDGAALGLAIDLRQNCTDLKHLTGNYFGNAAWCLHIVSSGAANQAGAESSSSISSSNSKSESRNGNVAAAAAAAGSGLNFVGMKTGLSYSPALQVAASTVRRGLTSFRQSKCAGNTLLQLIEAQQAAPTSVLVRNFSRLAVKVDAFITSWQFPVHQINFGGGAAAEYCCVVRPTPPWQAAVLPSRPAVGGAQLLLTVPASAAAALKASPVLKQLVPNASFQE